jgi:hypothetical protein
LQRGSKGRLVGGSDTQSPWDSRSHGGPLQRRGFFWRSGGRRMDPEYSKENRLRGCLRVYLWVAKRDGRDEDVVGGNRRQKVNTCPLRRHADVPRVGQNRIQRQSAAGKTSVNHPTLMVQLASVHEPAPPCRLCHVDFNTKVDHPQFFRPPNHNQHPLPPSTTIWPQPTVHPATVSAIRETTRSELKAPEAHHVRRGLSCGATGRR